MTRREELLAQLRAQAETACDSGAVDLVLRLAQEGMPAEQILDAYRFTHERNEVAIIEALKHAEAILDREIARRETDEGLTSRAVGA